MMGNKPLIVSAVDRLSSILDRNPPLPNQRHTEAQALTDHLVSISIQEATNPKTAAAIMGAGWAGRATRIGVMTSAPGQTALSQVVRGGSYLPSLAAESATFAGIERGFQRMDGHPSAQPFQKDWAHAAVTLTGLKLFGGMSREQNIVFQHLFTDLGLVGSQHAAHAIHLTDKPQGSFPQQMLRAEAVLWQMKGSLALAQGVSPGFFATEMSLDIYLKNQKGLFIEKTALPIFLQTAMVGANRIASEKEAVWKMTGRGDGGPYRNPDPIPDSVKVYREVFTKQTKSMEDKITAIQNYVTSLLEISQTLKVGSRPIFLQEVNAGATALKELFLNSSNLLRMKALSGFEKLAQHFSSEDPLTLSHHCDQIRLIYQQLMALELRRFPSDQDFEFLDRLERIHQNLQKKIPADKKGRF